jgi:vacuolar-type H+-ATPase subunit I/STV1
VEIIRPVLQAGLDELIRQAIDKFSQKLQHDNQVHLGALDISVQIPTEEKEAFSFTSAAVIGLLSAVFLGPVGIVLSSLVGGILGRSDNEDERQNAIAQQVDNQVIPQALSSAMQQVDEHLSQVVSDFRVQIMAQLEQEAEQVNKELSQLQAQQQQKSQEFAEQQDALAQALHRVQECKSELEQ